MIETSSSQLSSQPPEQQRQALLGLLRRQPRGAAKAESPLVEKLILELERSRPADLADPAALAQLEGVWELRWSSSSQPYLAVTPWLENLQLLAPSQGRGMNLLRLSGPLIRRGQRHREGFQIRRSADLGHTHDRDLVDDIHDTQRLADQPGDQIPLLG